VRGERDSYILSRKISTGGMGVVWEGKSSQGRRVALKQPLINRDHDEVKLERLLIEARVLQQLNDELGSVGIKDPIRNHVVRYLDQCRDLTAPSLVTEYLLGGTASNIFAQKPLPERVATREILVLLDTVRAIHSRAVIHRDISPSNIFYENERGMVLIDFGASVLEGADLTSASGGKQTDRVVFKKGFSGPELLERRSGFRSDLFSVGATFFYFLTGRNPADFAISTTGAVDQLPKDVGSGISKASFEIIRTAMSPNPENRFASADAMINAMEAIIKDEAVPSLTIAGKICELSPDFVDVGRVHECNANCRSQGYTRPIQVRVLDHNKFIEKHHARIWVDMSGGCSIEDLGSVNRTAVKHAESKFIVLPPGVREVLKDGDTVGLAYNRERGPYVTFTFNEGVRKPK